jgi:Fe-S cluster assembly protein SufD
MNADSKDRFLADFARVARMLPGAGVPWLARLRHAGLERFAQSGFPTTRDEEWKYTSLAAIEKRNFQPVPHDGDVMSMSSAQLEALALSRFPGHRLVFVNGWYVPALSAIGRLPAGVKLESLVDALEEAPDSLQPALTDESEQTVFGALNTAFMTDGVYIDLPRGTVVEEPIHLFFVATRADAAIHPRNVIVAGEGAQLTVIHHYAGADGTTYLTNAVTQIFAARGAGVDHYKLQEEALPSFHIAGIHAAQAHGSRFLSHSIALGAALARNDISTTFDAEHCEATLNGLYVVRGRQHVDHHTRIDHLKPDGTSREYYRGLLDGASRGVFNGKVIVHPQAQRTDAHQINHNLLLSKDAEIDTKPQLEIYADDVKCTHGAAVGQLDDAQLFYLRSRGIDEVTARSLLIYAFARDVIERIRVASLRAVLEHTLLARLPEGDRIRELT